MMKPHELLKKYIKKNQKSSAGFSIRSLARRVGVSAAFLSRVLNGQKAMPETLFEKLRSELNIEPELFDLSHRVRARKKTVPLEVPQSLLEWEIADRDANRILRSWYYLPILELTTLSDYDGSEEMVAAGLGLPLPTVRLAMKELIEIGLLNSEAGRISKAQAKIRFTGSKSMESVRRFHSEMLAKAKSELRDATSDEDRNRRLISGITVTATPEAVQAAKQKLNEVLHEIANDLTSEPGTEVYHLALQFFPLTKK